VLKKGDRHLATGVSREELVERLGASPLFQRAPQRRASLFRWAIVWLAAAQAVGAPAAWAANPTKTKPKEITFDSIKLDLKKDQPFRPGLLTDDVKKLDKVLVRLRGYILPGVLEKGITQFVLVRDNMECCFGPGAALHDCVMVEMNEGVSVEFTTRPVTVEGVFSLREIKTPDGMYLSIYRLAGRSVK